MLLLSKITRFTAGTETAALFQLQPKEKLLACIHLLGKRILVRGSL
jgi:hypothetical protein